MSSGWVNFLIRVHGVCVGFVRVFGGGRRGCGGMMVDVLDGTTLTVAFARPGISTTP